MGSSETIKTDKVSFSQMLGFGSATFGSEFIYSTVGIFAMYFLTDVAIIGAALAGVILLLARFWDAFFDLIIGYISDHTKSRWGQRRPYILFGTIPLAVCFILFFQTPQLFGDAKFIYYLVLMLLMWTVYSITYVPYTAMVPNITRDAKQRSSVMGVARFMSMIGLIIVGALTRPLAGAFSTPQIGWSTMAIIFGSIMAVFTLITFFTVRERYGSEGSGYQVKDVFKLIGKNKPFLNLCFVTLCVFIVFTATGTMLNYFFKYCIRNESMVSISFLFTFGLGALFLPLWVYIAGKIGKKTVYILGLLIYGLSFAALYWYTTDNLMTLLPLFISFAIGFSGVSLSIFSLVPDTVEYGEWKMGVRNEGLQYGLYTFFLKLATSLGAIMVGIGLDIYGYVANVDQTAGSLMGIRVLTSFIPAAIALIGAVILLFYPITEKMHAQMVKDIAERKSAAAR